MNQRVGVHISKEILGESYKAYIPPKLSPALVLNITQLYPYLEKATLALTELNGVTRLIPNTSLFVYMYVRKEALLSSQIEGTQSSLSDLMLFEHHLKPTVSLDDVEEVSNYVKAVKHGINRLNNSFPLSLRLLREIHGILLSGSRGSTKLPGEFRKSQNWIGGTRPGNALFVPPPIEYLNECLADFEKFLHDDTLPLLIKAAIAHVQFESIHPFLDGNGRLGRLLIVLLICNNGMLDEPILYLSLYLKQNKQQYYDLLQEVRHNGAWETWIEFFLEGIISTSKQTLATIKKISAIFENDLAKIESLGRARFSCIQALEYLKQLPQVTVQLLSQELKMSLPTARSSLNHMTLLRITKETSGKQRDKVYVYQKYLNILEERTPLVEASRYGKLEIVKQLLDSGEDINDYDTHDGKTALHCAAQFSHPFEILELLLKHPDIDVNIKDNNDHTALYYATDSGWFKAVSLIAPKTEYEGLKKAHDIAQQLIHASNPDERKKICEILVIEINSRSEHKEILEKEREFKERLKQKQRDWYADSLTEEERSLSEIAINNLSKVKWCTGLLKKAECFRKKYNDSKLTFPKDKQLQLKQTMFEVRFAAAINRTGYIAQNEYKAVIGNSSVDFKVTDTNQQEWLVELTSPRTSDAVKENTKILENGIQQYSSTTSSQDKNTPEVRDIIKTQDTILSKVADKEKEKPTKFPLITDSKAYHIIVVSINSFNNSASDQGDYINIVYGSEILTKINDGLDVRYWYDSKEDKWEMIKGVFDPDHINPRAKILQARVHAICFIKEEFKENKVEHFLYVNRKFEKDERNKIKEAFNKIVKYL
jgi:Fic family protein/ribosomal protein S8